MGRKSKQLHNETYQNIGALFRATPQPRPAKMAPAREASEHSLDDSMLEAAEASTKRGSTRSESTPPPEQMPASKADIIYLLKELKAQSAADMALIREDLGTMTARIQAVEVNEAATTPKIETLQREMAQMKQTSTILENKVAALEDAKRQRNLRIRGIPEAVQDPDVTHYLRRLLASLLLPANAKSILLEFHFRIPKPPRAPADVPQDLLICFQSLRGKLLVQEATRETNTYEFEGSELSFYNDLSRATVTWRHSMKEVTQLLRTKGIQYRWGPGCRLSVSNEGKRVHVTQASDSVAFLQALGISQEATTSTTSAAMTPATTSKIWDVKRIQPFFPRTSGVTGTPQPKT
ncbi:Hypothetical predicted protein [Pelobates cultripes]|uniref:Uncharacterized protein n=1 Tax=Pelobates cultripes TaxID=61616 RepID=A0AAD1VQM7_PELCU|nr:Hypothetical predicted protein [Pelobates cultripes]